MPVGDPYITRTDGKSFEFKGEPYARYNVYSQGDLRVLSRLAPVASDPSRQYVCGTDIHLGESQVYIANDVSVHVFHNGHHVRIEMKFCTLDAPGHHGNTRDEAHPLQGVPHLNVYLDHDSSSDHAGATGLQVDGSEDSDPATYFIDG
jgi:hypothetical protein